MPRGAYTKEYIFNEAVRLFSEKSYDVVTTREIASAAHVNESSIYNHFESKADILNEIFKLFGQKLEGYLITEKQVDRYIQTDTPRRLLERYVQNFKNEEAEFMLRAYRIVYMEQLTNQVARDLVVNHIHGKTAESIKYVLDVLIENKKIPAFDTKLFSVLWSQSMFSGAVTWMVQFFNGQTAEMLSSEFHGINEFLIEMAICGKVPDSGNQV